MISGLVSGTEARFLLNTTPIPFCRRSTGESFCFGFNTNHPKISISIENRFGSFRTKAAINDGFMTSSMNFYQLLGISENGSFSDIRQAYKQLARKYHPDVSPPERIEEYTKRFILVHEAYETLSDPNMRALYDRDLSRSLHLAFSVRNGYGFDEGLVERNNWRINWQFQLEGLKRKSMNKDSRENMSWGAQMRGRRNESSANV